MRYANWGEVVGRLNDGAITPFGDWARREGPREVARRMDACRVEDGPNGEPTWLVTAESLANARGPSMDPMGWAVCKWWVHDTAAASFFRFPVGEARVFPFHVDAVRDDLGLIRDWHLSVAANARAGLPAAEFDALPAEARAVAMTARRALRRLPHTTFAEAKAASDAWHREEAERQRQYQANYAHRNGMLLALFDEAPPEFVGFEVVPLAPAVGEGERHPVPDLPDHYWCRLETRDAYRQESARMSHCVGWASQDYAERYLGKPMPQGIWSLRHGDESLLTAEVGFEWIGRIGDRTVGCVVVRQVRAAHNHPVPPKYAAAVRWLEAMRVAPKGMGMAA